MGDLVEIGATDGHRFKAYRAQPNGQPKATVILAPEIFGVNAHIRGVADDYAAAGYLALAPQLFDRSERDYEAGYEQTDIEAGVAIIQTIGFDEVLRDLSACIQFTESTGNAIVIGYCWGGTIAWLASARLAEIRAAVAYYGGGIPDFVDEAPQSPIMLHFAEQDKRPTHEQAKEIAAQYPQAESHFYPAGHGFNCDQRGSFHADSAALALTRTRDFIERHSV